MSASKWLYPATAQSISALPAASVAYVLRSQELTQPEFIMAAGSTAANTIAPLILLQSVFPSGDGNGDCFRYSNTAFTPTMAASAASFARPCLEKLKVAGLR